MEAQQITSGELFDRCFEVATATSGGASRNRLLHETLLLACEAASEGGRTGFGNLFHRWTTSADATAWLNMTGTRYSSCDAIPTARTS